MLTNLKLGGISPITLIPADSDVENNFTLLAIRTDWLSFDDRYDIAVVYGPITGDTEAESTDYGYLYSWAAATPGETRVTAPAGSGTAIYSDCPAG